MTKERKTQRPSTNDRKGNVASIIMTNDGSENVSSINVSNDDEEDDDEEASSSSEEENVEDDDDEEEADEEENESGTIDPLAPPMIPSGGGNVRENNKSNGGETGNTLKKQQLPSPPLEPTPTLNAIKENTSDSNFVGGKEKENNSVGGKENASDGDIMGGNDASTVKEITVVENTSDGGSIGKGSTPTTTPSLSTGGRSSLTSITLNNNYYHCNQTDVQKNTGPDLVAAKEDRSEIVNSSNENRKNISIISNVHLLREEPEEYTPKERKNNEGSNEESSNEEYDHDGTVESQSASAAWNKRYLQNGDVIHVTKKQKKHHRYQQLMSRPSSFMNKHSPTRFLCHRNSFVTYQITNFEKLIESANAAASGGETWSPEGSKCHHNQRLTLASGGARDYELSNERESVIGSSPINITNFVDNIVDNNITNLHLLQEEQGIINEL